MLDDSVSLLDLSPDEAQLIYRVVMDQPSVAASNAGNTEEKMLIRGDKLNDQQRTEVLSAFIYRWTSDNPRRAEVYGRCPHCKTPGGKPDMSDAAIPCRQHHPTVPLQTDAQWLGEHAFHFTKDGRHLMGNKRHAEPTSFDTESDRAV